jgi:hypothetical protein
MKKSTTLKKAQAGGSKSSYKTTNEVYTNALNGKDRTYEKKQVLQKGDKTVVNKKSFTKLASGSKFPTAKSTTVYDKKTGVTKKAANKPSITGFGQSEGSVKYTTAKKK